jgi:hypothetical protein
MERVVNSLLWSGTAVETYPGNAVHRKMLPDGTIPNVSGTNPAAASDWHYVPLGYRCKRVAVSWRGTVVAVSGLSAGAGTSNEFWTVPIRLFATASPYVAASGADWETSHPAVVNPTDWDIHGGDALQWGGSPVFGLGADLNNHYGQGMTNGFSSSAAPSIQPGIIWGMSNNGTGDILPAAADISTGFATLGFAPEGNSLVAPATNAVRVGDDASMVDGLWIFSKLVWPPATTLAYSTPSMTVTGELRLLGFA